MTYDEVWDLIEYGLIAFAILVFAIEMLRRLWVHKRQARRPVRADDSSNKPLMSRRSNAV